MTGEVSARDEKLDARGDAPHDPPRLINDPAARADRSATWALRVLRAAQPHRTAAGLKRRVQLRLGLD
jgi:hypothetical protein